MTTTTDTQTTHDHSEAAQALHARWGNFVLLGARSNPFLTTNTVLSAWAEPAVHPTEQDDLPTFRYASSVGDVVDDIEVFLGERFSAAKYPAPRWDKNDPAVQKALGQLQEELDSPEFAEAFTAEQDADNAELYALTANDDYFDEPYDTPEVEADRVAAAVADDEASAALAVEDEDALNEFTLVQLRKASRSVLTGGYSMKKSDLIDALLGVGITAEHVREMNGL